jgi:pimeloyl-ACP methyl ester carboxylesterase
LEGAGGCPVLLVSGRQDRVVPRSAIETYNRVLTGSTLVEIDQCGHRPEVEKTEQFVDEVKRFLAG